MIYGGEYRGSLEDLNKFVERAKRKMRLVQDEFDSIIVRGVSGLLVGSPVAVSLKKPLLIVRKPSEGCHDTNKLVNWQNAGQLTVFLDDFRNTGHTEQKVEEELQAQVEDACKIAACFFYADPDVPKCWAKPLGGWRAGFTTILGERP